MVDSIVSTVLDRLVSATMDKVQEEVRLVIGAPEDVKKLISNFRAIKAVLEDANQRQLDDAHIRLWIDNLKDVSYDIDDVLEEWSSALEKAKNEEADQHVLRKSTKSKVCLCCPFQCFGWEEVVLRRDIARKIKDLNQRLDDIATQRKDYKLKEMKNNEKRQRQKTTSGVDETEVKGRDGDKEKLVNMLLGGSSGQVSNVQVIAVVGMGGLGKSTLAQLVYNEVVEKDFFEKTMWVFVSDFFDETKIARAILESLTKDATQLLELEEITRKIKDLIRKKKFLLVLDDVWNESLDKWEPIRNCLNYGGPGSKILVTTRKETVARTMGCCCTEDDLFPIGKLSREDGWSLFGHFAFRGWSDRMRDQLDLERDALGMKVVDMCEGLPLALKTLGSYLNSYKSRQNWEGVLQNQVWRFKADKVPVLPSLWFSYNDLFGALKQCFSYCSVFPKGHTIRKYKLIEAWMAQGYLNNEGDDDKKMVGEEYFQDLVDRSFFQNLEMDEDGELIESCKMHDLVHDLALFVANSECRFMRVFSSASNTNAASSSSSIPPRHSMIEVIDQTQLSCCLDSLKKVRTLCLMGNYLLTFEHGQLDIFTKLTCLRSLDFSDCRLTEILSAIGCLVHLRRLDLSGNFNLKDLPEELCELYNLQILDISGCWILKLPKGIGKLIKLEHLHNYSSQTDIPRGLERLTALKTLDVFNIGSDDEAASLKDLGKLKNLQGHLQIYGLGEVEEVREATQAELHEKKNLTGLALYFTGSKLGDGDHESLLEDLHPPASLTSLSTYVYQGAPYLPSWMMSLTSLRKVEMAQCSRWNHLPPFGKLPALESLEFSFMYELERVGNEFLGVEKTNASKDLVAFPKLIDLTFVGLLEWREWEDCHPMRADGEEDTSTKITIMPRLSSLKLILCPKLHFLPSFIVQQCTSEKIQVGGCPALHLPEECSINPWSHGRIKNEYLTRVGQLDLRIGWTIFPQVSECWDLL